MRHTSHARRGLTLALALLAGTWFAPLAPAMAQSGDDPAFSAQDINSFAGAFLAARTADTDSDLDAAIGFYRMALEFQPEIIRRC